MTLACRLVEDWPITMSVVSMPGMAAFGVCAFLIAQSDSWNGPRGLPLLIVVSKTSELAFSIGRPASVG